MNTEPKKLRKAELLNVPNKLKEKVGSGGIDQALIAKAQAALDANTVDFIPIGDMLLKALDEALLSVTSGKISGEPAIESILYPVMQIKAQGAMFHYPLATDVSDILINFLETVTDINSDVMEIIQGHKKVLHTVLQKQMKDDTGLLGKQFCIALQDACKRYHRNLSPADSK